MNSQEKQDHADMSELAIDHPFVVDAVDLVMRNIGTNDNLVRFGLFKIASVAAQVARAQALGIDPEELRMTDVEYRNHLKTLFGELS